MMNICDQALVTVSDGLLPAVTATATATATDAVVTVNNLTPEILMEKGWHPGLITSIFSPDTSPVAVTAAGRRRRDPEDNKRIYSRYRDIPALSGVLPITDKDALAKSIPAMQLYVYYMLSVAGNIQFADSDADDGELPRLEQLENGSKVVVFDSQEITRLIEEADYWVEYIDPDVDEAEAIPVPGPLKYVVEQLAEAIASGDRCKLLPADKLPEPQLLSGMPSVNFLFSAIEKLRLGLGSYINNTKTIQPNTRSMWLTKRVLLDGQDQKSIIRPEQEGGPTYEQVIEEATQLSDYIQAEQEQGTPISQELLQLNKSFLEERATAEQQASKAGRKIQLAVISVITSSDIFDDSDFSDSLLGLLDNPEIIRQELNELVADYLQQQQGNPWTKEQTDNLSIRYKSYIASLVVEAETKYVQEPAKKKEASRPDLALLHVIRHVEDLPIIDREGKMHNRFMTEHEGKPGMKKDAFGEYQGPDQAYSVGYYFRQALRRAFDLYGPDYTRNPYMMFRIRPNGDLLFRNKRINVQAAQASNRALNITALLSSPTQIWGFKDIDLNKVLDPDAKSGKSLFWTAAHRSKEPQYIYMLEGDVGLRKKKTEKLDNIINLVPKLAEIHAEFKVWKLAENASVGHQRLFAAGGLMNFIYLTGARIGSPKQETGNTVGARTLCIKHIDEARTRVTQRESVPSEFTQFAVRYKGKGQADASTEQAHVINMQDAADPFKPPYMVKLQQTSISRLRTYLILSGVCEDFIRYKAASAKTDPASIQLAEKLGNRAIFRRRNVYPTHWDWLERNWNKVDKDQREGLSEPIEYHFILNQYLAKINPDLKPHDLRRLYATAYAQYKLENLSESMDAELKGKGPNAKFVPEAVVERFVEVMTEIGADLGHFTKEKNTANTVMANYVALPLMQDWLTKYKVPYKLMPRPLQVSMDESDFLRPDDSAALPATSPLQRASVPGPQLPTAVAPEQSAPMSGRDIQRAFNQAMKDFEVKVYQGKEIYVYFISPHYDIPSVLNTRIADESTDYWVNYAMDAIEKRHELYGIPNTLPKVVKDRLGSRSPAPAPAAVPQTNQQPQTQPSPQPQPQQPKAAFEAASPILRSQLGGPLPKLGNTTIQAETRYSISHTPPIPEAVEVFYKDGLLLFSDVDTNTHGLIKITGSNVDPSSILSQVYSGKAPRTLESAEFHRLNLETHGFDDPFPELDENFIPLVSPPSPVSTSLEDWEDEPGDEDSDGENQDAADVTDQVEEVPFEYKPIPRPSDVKPNVRYKFRTGKVSADGIAEIIYFSYIEDKLLFADPTTGKQGYLIQPVPAETPTYEAVRRAIEEFTMDDTGTYARYSEPEVEGFAQAVYDAWYTATFTKNS